MNELLIRLLHTPPWPARAPLATTASGEPANSAAGTGQAGSAWGAFAPGGSGASSLQSSALIAAGVAVLVGFLA
jgi:hypothetical protein